MSPVEINELQVRAATDPSQPIQAPQRHYLGLFSGVVTDNTDPDGKCRIKAKVPEVMADADTGWCVPALPYVGDGVGFAAVPPVGAQVWIQWPGGDLTSPPIWCGGSFAGGSGVPGAGPKIVILLTPGGHRIELDDDGDAIRIKHSQGANITMDDTGVTIDNGQGATIVMQGPIINMNNGAFVVQ